MNGTAIAKRYADGFLGYARSSSSFEHGLEELRVMKNILYGNPEFVELLESPVITYSEKCAFLKKTLKGRLSDEMLYFMQLLVKKKRISSFYAIAEYARLKYAHGEELSGVVKTAYMLDTAILQAINDALEKKMKRKMHLYMDFDHTLLGGIQVMIGNTVIDGSVRRRLDEIRENLMRMKVT